jgi:hypothetical protein
MQIPDMVKTALNAFIVVMAAIATMYLVFFWGAAMGEILSRQPPPHYNSEGKRDTF